MATLKTPISFYGGKSRIASKIVPHILAIAHTVYVEPYFGGGAVLYAKGRKPVTDQGHYREAINDINKQLIIFWRVAREQPEELARWISLTPYSQEEHREARKIYNNSEGYGDIKVAWATYIECNMSFSSTIGRGWSTSVNGRDNDGSKWANRTSRLPECFERLKDIYIACEDALSFIKRWSSANTVIYADPPYPNAHQGHYGGYTLDDYQALCDTLDNCQSSYILSNYHQEIAPKSAQKCVEIAATMSAAGGKNLKDMDTKRTEKLWICDRSANIRDDLKAIANLPNKQQLLFFPSLIPKLAVAT